MVFRTVKDSTLLLTFMLLCGLLVLFLMEGVVYEGIEDEHSYIGISGIAGLETESDVRYHADKLDFNVKYKSNGNAFKVWFRKLANQGGPVMGDSLVYLLGAGQTDNVTAADDLLRSLVANAIIFPTAIQSSFSTRVFLCLERGSGRVKGARYAREYAYAFNASNPKARRFAMSMGMSFEEIAPPFDPPWLCINKDQIRLVLFESLRPQ